MKIAGRCLIAVGIIMGIIFYYFYAFDNFHVVVEERIYRSAQLSGHKLRKIINKNRIRTIINLKGLKTNKNYKIESEIANKNNVKLFNFKFSAHKLPSYLKLNTLIDTLINAEKPILIHCHRGADRTGMAVALALAIEKGPPLSALKKQFSLRYGVIRFNSSIGPLLFSQYEKWLNMTGNLHSRDNLLFWVKKEYVDPNGNLEFYIDFVENVMFDEDNIFTIQNVPPKISVVGWAFDARNKLPVEDLYIIVDDTITDKVEYKYNRQDVVSHFGFDKKSQKGLFFGWLAEFDREDLTDGCHKISLKFLKNKHNEIKVPTNYMLCIKK
jgi:hypothetical protein